jgi:hypothetical protein
MVQSPVNGVIIPLSRTTGGMLSAVKDKGTVLNLGT